MKMPRTRNHSLLLACMNAENIERLTRVKAAAEVITEAIDAGASYDEVKELAENADEVLNA